MAKASKTTKSRKNSVFKHLMSIHWWMFYCYIALFIGGTLMARLPRELIGRNLLYEIKLSKFGFREREKFSYEYNFNCS